MKKGLRVITSSLFKGPPLAGVVKDVRESDGVHLLDIIVYAHDGVRKGCASGSRYASGGFEADCPAEEWNVVREK